MNNIGNQWGKVDSFTPGNTWYALKHIFKWILRVRKNDWIWARNQRCKYVTIRIDTRNGRVVIQDRDGEVMTPDELNYQYNKVFFRNRKGND